MKKLTRALAIAGCVALQAACGSSSPTGTTGGSGGATGTAAGGASTGSAVASSTGTTGGSVAGSSTGSSTGGGSTSCSFDSDCACGQVCSWATSTHHCVAASTGDPGWCDSAPNCLYDGQMCSGTSCTPAWTAASVCDKN